MSSKLSRFEELAERLVEGSLARLFADGVHPQAVASRLTRAMEDFADGDVAPDRYLVHLYPEDYERLISMEPELVGILSSYLVEQAERASLVLRHEPVIELIRDPDGAAHSIVIVAETRDEERHYTRPFEPVQAQRESPGQQPDGSTYLIVDGSRHFPLDKALYTLGRRLDCDIVLADPRVSRRHAQLRWRSGRYVLFDLGSTGGTRVNGHRIREAVLEPGDVFSLGGVDIIVGIEARTGEHEDDKAPTRPWNGPAGEAEVDSLEIS